MPIEVDVSAMNMGDTLDIYPYQGRIEKDGKEVAQFALRSDVLLDEVRAGGRINLIIGRGLTARAREALRPAGFERVPPAGATGRSQPMALPWRKRWSAAPAGCRRGRACAREPTGTAHDHGRFAGYHRADDARRA